MNTNKLSDIENIALKLEAVNTNTNKLSDIENIALKLEAVNTNIDKFFKDMENIILELQAVGTKSSIQKANRIAYYINIAKNGIIAIESLKTDKK